jgi:hypothetical protein
VTLNDPDGIWKTPEGDMTHGYYSMDEWKKANKGAKWHTRNVPGDGMCGWASILLNIGWLTLDDMLLDKKQPCGWKPEGWVKLLDFLKEVSIFIRTTLEGIRTNLTDHLVSGMDSSLNDTLADGITHDPSSYDMKRTRALQLADLLWQSSHVQPIKQPERYQQVERDLWFSTEYGNFVSAMLKRPIVVMLEIHDYRQLKTPMKFFFPFYTPRQTTARGVPGLKYQFGTWNAFSFPGLRKVFRETGMSNPVHLMLTQDNSHYKPFYKKLPGAQLTRMCPLHDTQSVRIDLLGCVARSISQRDSSVG